jgi:signal transduction histidine kinase
MYQEQTDERVEIASLRPVARAAVSRDIALPAQAATEDNRDVLISMAPARPQDRRLAIGVVAMLTLAFLALIPFARTPWTRIDAFIPAYEAALAITDILTAVLLFAQFSIVRSRALLVLACGYVFTALTTVPHVLSFPGAFAPTGLFGAGTQTTAWLYMFWHSGFPLVVVAYALLKNGHRRETLHPAIAVAATIGIVAVLAGIAYVGGNDLPPIVQGTHYTTIGSTFLASVWLLSVVALVTLWRRRPHALLDIWLMVVLCAWVYDIALSAVFNAGRFDFGFYAGRFYGLMAASFVLIVLLAETTWLYGRLAASRVRLRDYAKTLESRVRERTSALEQSNAQLQHETKERQQAEAQLVHAQKMEAIGNLTGGMAHDFNNLLGVIIGNLDLLRDTPVDPAEAKEMLHDALEAALKGADLTRRLLAFARRQPLRPEPVDVNELVSGMMNLLRRVLRADIEVSLDLAEDVWTAVVDPAQLEASLTNLATNARDAMPRGGRLAITTGNRELDEDYAALHAGVLAGPYAMIEVSDTGTGMPPDVISRIFEPFYTTKEQGKGTGLGLSMVYGFIKQSGGHINVYSEPGIGTTFRLYLPRAQAGAAAEQRTAVETLAHGAGETVLVVEDNAGLRRVVTRQVRELGYRVLEAENAAAALALLEAESVDVLFADIVMPGELNGLELTRIVLDRWPQMHALLTSGFPAGINGRIDTTARVLTKPYRKAELAKALSESLHGAPGPRPGT